VPAEVVAYEIGPTLVLGRGMIYFQVVLHTSLAATIAANLLVRPRGW